MGEEASAHIHGCMSSTEREREREKERERDEDGADEWG